MFWVGFLVEVGFIGFGFTVAAGFLAGGVVGWFLLVLTCWFEPVLMVSLASFRNVVVVSCRLFLNILYNSMSSSHFTRRTALGKAGQLTFPLDLREFGSVSLGTSFCRLTPCRGTSFCRPHEWVLLWVPMGDQTVL